MKKHKINNFILTLSFIFFIGLPSDVIAKLNIAGSIEFKKQVKANIFEAEIGSGYLKELLYRIKKSPSIITVRAISNDQSTWHSSGKKSRSHTKPLDGKARGAQRNKPTDSVIYINKNRITRSHKTYASGTLIHELVHAWDLANGSYHGDYPIREKRAVFFQNIWRSKHSKALRTNYHNRFETNEYQKSIKKGKLKLLVKYFLAHNDLP